MYGTSVREIESTGGPSILNAPLSELESQLLPRLLLSPSIPPRPMGPKTASLAAPRFRAGSAPGPLGFPPLEILMTLLQQSIPGIAESLQGLEVATESILAHVSRPMFPTEEPADLGAEPVGHARHAEDAEGVEGVDRGPDLVRQGHDVRGAVADVVDHAVDDVGYGDLFEARRRQVAESVVEEDDLAVRRSAGAVVPQPRGEVFDELARDAILEYLDLAVLAADRDRDDLAC